MGLSPRDVDDSTLWQFQAARDGWLAANSSAEPAAPAMDDEQLADLGIEGF
jgi:hypothetical protein